MEQAATASSGAIVLRVHVLAGSSCNSVSGIHGGKLKVKITAKAIEGAANKALREVLADYFRVSKSSVTLLKGEHCRDKVISIAGDPSALLNRLEPLFSGD